MSIKIMSTVWASHLPETITARKRSSVKLVLLKLADNANDFGKCWPSIPRIAHETEMCEKSVERAIKTLRDAELIHVKTTRVNGVKHNTYYINIPLVESLRNEFEAKQEDVNDNPFLKSLPTFSPKPTDNWSQKKDQMSVESSLTINEPSYNNVESVRRSCDERLTEKAEAVKQTDRRFADQLTFAHNHCKTAMQILQELKADYPQIYDGSQAVEQWGLCELTLDWLAVSEYADSYTSFNAMVRVLLESLLQLRFSASNDDSVGLPKLLCVNAGDETLENIIEHEQILEV